MHGSSAHSTHTASTTSTSATTANTSSTNASTTSASTTSSSTGTSGSSTPAAPTLTLNGNALTVNAGGSVSVPITVSGGNHTSVTISGLTSYESVTDQLDGKVFTPNHDGSITLTAAEVNSGITLSSSYTGSDHPVNTLSVTATDHFDHHAYTSAAQSITVTDPPASSTSGSSTSGSGTSSSNALTLQVSGDQYNGDPQIEVFVDGQQVGGVYTVTADHSQGQTQTITINGNFDPTQTHQVEVQFVNDAWDGTSTADGHDRNVYVESISLNGQTLDGSQGTDNATNGAVQPANANEAVMDINGALAFNVPVEPPATTGTGSTGTGSTSGSTGTSSGGTPLTLQVSGDQYNGDPQIEVFVDGQQVGGVYTVTADHSQGQTQTITINGNFDPSQSHQVEVKFVNDAWDGTSTADGHDRNVYVESISLNGTTFDGSQGTDNATNGAVQPANANEAVMDINGTLTFNVPDPPVSGSGSSGSGSSTSGSSGTGSSSTGSSDPGSTGEVGTGASDPAQTSNAFYVSPNGSDSNPGTLNAPFATLQHAQQAMENSSVKTTYVEGGTYNLGGTITLTGADNGETWSYYAPNGVDSAVLDGGGNDLINIVGASNITIDGLTLQNGNVADIHVLPSAQSNDITIENCNVGFTHNGSGATTAGILVENAINSTVANNYVHDTAGQGISLYAYTAGTSVNGDVVTGNVVLRAGQIDGDIGAIYTDMDGSGLNGGHVTISNNYVADYGTSNLQNDMVGIYLDDNSSNVTVTGNVVGPPAPGAVNSGNANFTGAFLVHNGANDTITDNIVDLGSSGLVATVNFAQDNGNLGQGMSGDSFTNNVVISSYSGSENPTESGLTGSAYYESMNYTSPTPSPSNFTIANNDYFNYAGGQVATNGNVVSDSNPSFVNPELSGNYSMASNSSVYAAINFTPITGGWGPQGFVIPQSAINASSSV